MSVGNWKSFYVDEAPREGRFLMERDLTRLASLEDDPEKGSSLYLYRWSEPTISLGYAQREERVLDAEAVREAGVPVVRRPTGGRAILHVDEWTFAAVVPIADPGLGGSLRGSLASLSSIVARALAQIGVVVDSATGHGPTSATGGLAREACFHRALGHELLVGGRKLAGAAQRRWSRALLTQGTILAGPGHERLAEFLAGDRAGRALARESLAHGTVTIREVLGRLPDFAGFAEALRGAWERPGPGR